MAGPPEGWGLHARTPGSEAEPALQSRRGVAFVAAPAAATATAAAASDAVAADSVMPKHEFSVDMTCEGCAEAVSRVLNKLGGVDFNIDLPNKKVCIESEHSMDTLLATLNKTGKAVSYIGPK